MMDLTGFMFFTFEQSADMFGSVYVIECKEYTRGPIGPYF